jgi:hypothetical protein
MVDLDEWLALRITGPDPRMDGIGLLGAIEDAEDQGDDLEALELRSLIAPRSYLPRF